MSSLYLASAYNFMNQRGFYPVSTDGFKTANSFLS